MAHRQQNNLFIWQKWNLCTNNLKNFVLVSIFLGHDDASNNLEWEDTLRFGNVLEQRGKWRNLVLSGLNVNFKVKRLENWMSSNKQQQYGTHCGQTVYGQDVKFIITDEFDIKFTEKESVKLDGCCVRGFNRAWFKYVIQQRVAFRCFGETRTKFQNEVARTAPCSLNFIKQ